MSNNNSFELDSILVKLEQNSNPVKLLEEINQLEVKNSDKIFSDIKFYIARAEVLNRCGLVEDALNTIYDARNSISFKPENAAFFADLSRIASMIHSWRPNSEMCAFELLRSTAELQSKSLDCDPLLLRNLLQAGQLACETGRFEDALVILQPVVKSKISTKIIQLKATIWKLKALNALREFDRARQLENQILGKKIDINRIEFLLKIEILKTDNGLGLHTKKNKQSLAEIEKLLPENSNSFEHIEFNELKIEVDQSICIKEKIALIDRLVYRFEEDRLYARLASLLLLKAEIASQHSNSTVRFESLSRAAKIIAENHYTGLRTRLLMSANKGTVGPGMLSYTLLTEFNQPHRYLKGAVIGIGGQAKAYHAVDLFSGKSCVIKEVLDNKHLPNSDAINELENGLKICSNFSNSNILAAQDFYFSGNTLNLITALGIGEPLKIKNTRKLNQKQRIELCLKITILVNTIHLAGFVHADVKPENILVTEDLHTVQILDFGIARLNGEFNMKNEIKGTLGYIAPEIISGQKHISFAADVYALGRLFNNILENRKAFFSIIYGEYAIRRLFMRMQNTDPDRRPSLNDVMSELQTAL